MKVSAAPSPKVLFNLGSSRGYGTINRLSAMLHSPAITIDINFQRQPVAEIRAGYNGLSRDLAELLYEYKNTE